MANQTIQLRAGTPEYNRSCHASAWVQKIQLLRDIQADRGNVKKNRESAWKMVCQVFKHKHVGSLPVYLVTDFLAPVKIPISDADIQKSKNIENRVDKLHQVRHIFQKWNINQDPNKDSIDVIHHFLSVVVENRLSGSYPVLSYDKPSRTHAISLYNVSDLRNLCRLRYLKVSGNKNALVERLAAEKW